MRPALAPPLVVFGIVATGCADPCLDDGLGQKDQGNCAVLSGTETEASASSSGSDGPADSSEGDSSTSDATLDASSSSSADTTGSSSDDGSTTGGATTPWCLDQDADGFGDPTQCVDVPEGDPPPPDTVDNDDDCFDNDPQTFPGAAEQESASECMKDDDDDGWGDDMPPPGVDVGTDCLDGDATVFPGAAELESSSACMQDADGDGWGDATPPPDVDVGLDCADDEPDAFPGAAPLDDADACMLDDDDDDFGDASPPPSVTPGSDCADDDATVPAVMDCLLWCLDSDLDGFGDPGECVLEDVPPAGYVGNAEDCDDTNGETYPGTAENDLPAGACMEDDDDDGWGDIVPPPGVTAGSDCDDADAAVSVGCAPCPAGQLICNDDDDVAQCNANGTFAAVVDDCGFGCDELAVACWPPLLVEASPEVCIDIALGDSILLDATVVGGDGNYDYAWSPEDSLDDSSIEDPLATPGQATSYTLTVTDGEGNLAADSVTVNVEGVFWQLDADCELEVLPTVFGPSDLDPLFVFSQNGTVACNIANALPSAFVCPREFENVRVTGRITVQTANDNDAIGFVWGWQDAEHFYILNWKQATQPVPLWANGEWPAGVTIKRVQADAGPLDSEDMLRNIDTPNSLVLADPSTALDEGWDDFEEYDVTVDYASPNTTIVITRVSDAVELLDITVVDSTYPSGRFGTFDASQDQACNGPWTSQCL
jgi:Thrombospondin C-terminal region